MTTRTICVLATAAITSTAWAQAVNISQSRSVGARGAFSPWASDSTLATGAWDRDLVQTDGGFSSGGRARQNTTITATRIQGSGSAYANDDIQTTSGRAYSTIESFFEVVSPTSYRFSGSWSTTYDFYAMSPTCSMVLEQVSPISRVLHSSEFIVDWLNGSATTSGGADIWGDLPLGRYRLYCSVSMVVAMNPGVYSGQSQYQFDLQIPAPGALAMLGMLPVMTRRRRRAEAQH